MAYGTLRGTGAGFNGVKLSIRTELTFITLLLI